MFVNFWNSSYQQVYNSDVAKRHYESLYQSWHATFYSEQYFTEATYQYHSWKGFIELFIKNENTKKFALR